MDPTDDDTLGSPSWPDGQPPPWLAGGTPFVAPDVAPPMLAPTPDQLATAGNGPPAPLQQAAPSVPVGLPPYAPTPTTAAAIDQAAPMPAPTAGPSAPSSALPPGTIPIAPYLAVHGAVPLDTSLQGAPGQGVQSQPAPPWVPAQPAPTSGQAGQEDRQRLATVTDPNAPVADRQTAWSQLTPDQQTNLVNTADPSAMSALAVSTMSPEQLATLKIRHAQAQVDAYSAAQAKAIAADRDQAQKNLDAKMAADLKTASDEQAIDAERQALANTKIDTHPSVAKAIAGVLASTLGGLASPYTGGRNLALEAFQKSIQQSIDAQKDEIANKWRGLDAKQNVIGQSYQRTGDMYRTQEAFRLAAFDAAQKQLQVEAQNYDPRGTTALGIAQQTQAIGAARVQAQTAARQQLLDNNLKLAKAQQESDTLREQIREHNQTTALGYANLNQKSADDTAKNQIERDKLAEEAKQRLATQGQAQQERDIKEVLNDPATGAPLLGPKGKDLYAQAQALETQAHAATDPAKQQQLAAQADQLRTQAVTQYAVRRGDPAEHKTTQGQLDATQNFVDAAERLKHLLASDPSSFDRGVFAKATTDFEAAKQQYILTLPDSKVTSREMDATSKTLAGDPGSFFSRATSRNKLISSLDEAESIAGSDMATTLRGAGQQAPKGGSVWTPKIAKVQAIDPLADPTALEAGQDARLTKVAAPFSFTSSDDRQVAAENSSSFGRSGLSVANTKTIDDLVGAFGRTKDDEDRERIASQLAAYASSPRDPVASGVVNLVREDPAAYQAMLAAPTLAASRRADLVEQDQRLAQFRADNPGIQIGAGLPLTADSPDVQAAIKRLSPEQAQQLLDKLRGPQ